jgi:hypothetical protein
MSKPRKFAVEVHAVHVGVSATYNAPIHPERTQSAVYRRTRAALLRIVETVGDWYFGAGPYDDHHGGGLWVMDDDGWFFVRNLVGIEWAAQFCADPRKVDALRQNARRLYAGFPKSFAAFRKLGIELQRLLSTPITTPRHVANWTDSICNASVPLPQALHTGVLPGGAGVHNYPTPVTDIDRIRHRDFRLWVTDADGHAAAVVPVAPRGAGRGGVWVVHATPGTELARAHVQAQRTGGNVELPARHPLAKQAFAGQREGREVKRAA